MRRGGTDANPGRSASGFSMIEMLVATAILLVILTFAFLAFTSARKNMATESSAVETQQAGRISLDELQLSIQQAGYGISRAGTTNRAAWQRAIVYAGSHALAFNADIDPSVGPLAPSVTLTFPDGSTYAGEGAAATTLGAETYFYTIDANGDQLITQADRSAAASGAINPAAGTPNPLDYALFRRLYGYDGATYGGTLDPVTAYLFTNATSADTYPDFTSPNPLFEYWLTEDLNQDGRLDNAECVVVPCPPSSARDPQLYLWGDTDFNGTLSESEKAALRGLRVGAPAWTRNRLASGTAYPSTTLSAPADPAGGAVLRLKVGNGSIFAPGEHIQVGTGSAAERLVVASVNTSATPNEVYLNVSIENAHVAGEPVAALEQTFLRAIRSVGIQFDAITPREDVNAATNVAAVGRAGHAGTRGLEYRVRSLERKVDLPNLRVGR